MLQLLLIFCFDYICNMQLSELSAVKLKNSEGLKVLVNRDQISGLFIKPISNPRDTSPGKESK